MAYFADIIADSRRVVADADCQQAIPVYETTVAESPAENTVADQPSTPAIVQSDNRLNPLQAPLAESETPSRPLNSLPATAAADQASIINKRRFTSEAINNGKAPEESVIQANHQDRANEGQPPTVDSSHRQATAEKSDPIAVKEQRSTNPHSNETTEKPVMLMHSTESECQAKTGSVKHQKKPPAEADLIGQLLNTGTVPEAKQQCYPTDAVGAKSNSKPAVSEVDCLPQKPTTSMQNAAITQSVDGAVEWSDHAPVEAAALSQNAVLREQLPASGDRKEAIVQAGEPYASSRVSSRPAHSLSKVSKLSAAITKAVLQKPSAHSEPAMAASDNQENDRPALKIPAASIAKIQQAALPPAACELMPKSLAAEPPPDMAKEIKKAASASQVKPQTPLIEPLAVTGDAGSEYRQNRLSKRVANSEPRHNKATQTHAADKLEQATPATTSKVRVAGRLSNDAIVNKPSVARQPAIKPPLVPDQAAAARVNRHQARIEIDQVHVVLAAPELPASTANNRSQPALRQRRSIESTLSRKSLRGL